MSSFAATLTVFVTLQLLIVAALPQISFSLNLTEASSVGDIVQKVSGVEKGDPEPTDDGESEKQSRLLSAETFEKAKDSSTDLVDATLDDAVEETISSTKERISLEPIANPDTSDRDIVKPGNDDDTVVGEVLAEVSEGNVLSEPEETLNENLDWLTDDINLVEEDTGLQSAADSVKVPEDILKQPGTGALTDAIDDTVDDLEEIASDTDIVESLEPLVAGTVKEVEESAASIIDIEKQEMTDEILRETNEALRETGEQINSAAVKDTLGKTDLSTTVDEIMDDLDVESTSHGITQSLQDRADAIEADSLLSELREKPAIIDDLKDKNGSTAEPNQTSSADSNIPQQEHVSSLLSAGYRLKEVTLNQEKYQDVKIISNPELTQEEEQYIIDQALDAEGLEDWSDGGWRVVGMDFIGITKPQPKWEKAIVYLHLPTGAGTPPLECKQGWQAVIDVRLDVGKVSDFGLPTLESHECSSEIILQAPAEEGTSKTLTMSGTRPSFVMAETDDVVSNHIYGTAAYLNTPSVNSTVFGSMDSYVAFLLNQKWSTSPTQHMTQIGWLISSIEGCIDCGSQQIPKNTTRLAFTDSSVFGNLEAHSIPFFEWQDDEKLVAGTWCNEEGRYTVWAQYGSRVFNHNTNISCENPDNDSKVSNSIFLENWNTAESSSWTDHIGNVEAHSAVTFRTDGISQGTTLHSWEQSTNEEQDCAGARQSTATVQGNLTFGNAARWADLGSVSPAC
jgi:hypothetical protein